MRHFNNALERATGPVEPRIDRVLPNVGQSTGWRKATAGLVIAERLAEAGELGDVPKSRAFLAVKRVGAHVGLKAGDMMLLDTLGAFTQTQDWAAGQRPIVWASNAYLMEQTGFSLSALKRHARRLAELGMIAFQDSPNGKRWGRRDAEGVIVEAYGFDLSPLSARAEEFERLYERLQAERAICQRLRRQITVARRMIRARLEAAQSAVQAGPWAQLWQVFEEQLARLPSRHETAETLEAALAGFKALQKRVEAAFLAVVQPVGTSQVLSEQDAELIQKMNPREASSEPHIPTTNQLDPVPCNSSEHEETGRRASTCGSGTGTDGGLEEWVAATRRKRTALDLPTILQACPEFTGWARNIGDFVRDWSDLNRIAGQLRPMIGVSEHAWAVAQERLGKQVATTALVLVFEKHCAGEVASPGGYLRGMVEKAGAGALHLERSFYGRLSGRAA
ncbi:plasmid replication protein RepC [Seohaeicola nanhaiensis]|uniref:Plasmid replication protein RepC n=1 Tax=Seohaeicola nanhaiensis TaxID=1387282 RepID=A0ABV9KHT9_9RHOB